MASEAIEPSIMPRVEWGICAEGSHLQWRIEAAANCYQWTLQVEVTSNAKSPENRAFDI